MKQHCVNDLILLPQIKHCDQGSGTLPFCAPLTLVPQKNLTALAQTVATSYGDFFTLCHPQEGSHSSVDVHFCHTNSYAKEAYELIIDSGILIKYSDPSGALYALMTLRQMMLNGVLPHCHITDAPNLAVRGYMLDVSRGKIPKIASLKSLADTLASFKYNHLQLYFEGSPFVYPGYESFAAADAYTPSEIAEFDAYCQARCIELVPCINTLGHMSPWLAFDKFKHFAEKEEGLTMQGLTFPPTTLNCQSPEAFQFALSLIDGVFSTFQSNLINVGLDEPFELGKGKNAQLAAQVGTDALYAGYVRRLHKALLAQNKTMMMWGDIVAKNLDTAKAIPDDVILLEWGYQQEYPFDQRAAVLKKLGKPFILCPGTSAWNSFGGITDNMMANVANAAAAAQSHGAQGILLTDWGDGGHMQHPFVSLPAILLSAALSWGNQCNDAYLQSALNLLVFQDDNHILGGLILDIGRYAHYEEKALECRTLATIPFQFPSARGSKLAKIEAGLIQLTLSMLPADLHDIYQNKMSQTQPFDSNQFDAYLQNLTQQLSKVAPACPDALHLTAEITNTIALIAALSRARALLSQNIGSAKLATELRRIAAEHKRLWLVKNRPAGVEIGFDNLHQLANNLDQ